MGNNVSLNMFNPAHVRIYDNLLKIKSPDMRLQMIETLLSGSEYVSSAKHAGIYSALLSYVTALKRGVQPQPLPGETNQPVFYSQQQQQQQQQQNAGQQQFFHLQQQSRQSQQQQQQQQQQYQQHQRQQITIKDPQQKSAWQQVAKKPKEKAISYFNSCLEVLNLSEQQALTDDTLKAAYKKAAIRAHPDKGGSEEQFEAITRAYAYLSDIIKRISGSQISNQVGYKAGVEEIQDVRTHQDDKWKHVEPVKLNPKNLNMEMFNRMYEQTRMADPDEDGYGDWLKDEGKTEEPKFSGKFNRDVFNSMFEQNAAKKGYGQEQQLIQHPNAMALTLAPSMGTEIGRDRPTTYTAPVNSSLHYTDLRDAYTKESTISDKVANVRVEHRDMKKYQADREKAPTMNEYEKGQLLEQEREIAKRETERQVRAAQEAIRQNDHFKKMKQYVLTG